VKFNRANSSEQLPLFNVDGCALEIIGVKIDGLAATVSGDKSLLMLDDLAVGNTWQTSVVELHDGAQLDALLIDMEPIGEGKAMVSGCESCTIRITSCRAFVNGENATIADVAKELIITDLQIITNG